MAFYQSTHARGLVTPPRGLSSGVVMCAHFKFQFIKDFVFNADQLELGILPAFATVRDAIVVGGATGTITANIGLMSGQAGQKDPARTVGTELFTAANVSASISRLSVASGFAIAPTDADRGIGATFSSTVVADPTGAKRIELLLFYTM